MVILNAKGLSDGIGKGTLHFIKKNTEEKYSANVQEEEGRIKNAVEESLLQLRQVTEIYAENKTISQVLEVHSMLTEDVSFLTRINNILYEEECNAEYAVFQASKQIAREIESLPDNYLSERKSDVEDVAGRIISNLSEDRDLLDLYDSNTIIVADELLPSELLKLDREKISGVVLKKGSSNSHTAILLRSLGIPAVFNLDGELPEYYEGMYAYVDGFEGILFILPDEKTEADYEEKILNNSNFNAGIVSINNEDEGKSDNDKISILCNINLPQDLEKVLNSQAEGIGLFRTEFLFLKNNILPTEEQQFECYKEVVSKMGERKVVIRTLDIGADKISLLLHNVNIDGDKQNDNGIRFCLNRPEIFKSQLRAIYRASKYGNISIVLPAVMNSAEVAKTKFLCSQIKESLIIEGYDVKEIPIGSMIENESAVNCAEELAKEVDFFSIGTNDLSLSLLHPNRTRSDFDEDVDYHDSRVIEAINIVAKAAKEAEIPVSVCGEMAADEEMIPRLIAAGIDEISVNPSKVNMLFQFCRRL